MKKLPLFQYSFQRGFDLKKWVFLFISTLFIAYIYQKTHNPIIEQRAEILQDAYYVNELQTSILETVTLSQSQNLNHFDTINAQISSLQKVLIKLSKNQAIIETSELQTQVNNLLAKAKEQQKHIESFKTKHALIHNSLNYLPTSFNLCFSRANDIENDFYDEEILSIIQETALTGLTVNQSSNQTVIDKLNKNIRILKDNDVHTICRSFIQHSSLLSNYIPQMQKNYSSLYEIQLDQSLHQFYIAIEKQTSIAVTKNNQYYVIMSIFAFLLLVYIGLTLNSLYRTNSRLSSTLSELSEQQGLFTTLIKVNAVIIETHEPTKLFQEVCDITSHEANIDNCWIGLLDDNDIVVPAAVSGLGKEVVYQIRPSINTQTESGKGTIAESFQTGKPVITNDYKSKMIGTPWLEQAKQWDVQGSATLPIKVDEEIIGFLVTYTCKSNFFNHKINTLLIQLADDIGIALEKIHLEEEQIKQQQDLAVAAIAFESHEAIIITNADKEIIRVNKAFTQLTGFSQEETLGNTPAIIKSGLHNREFYKNFWSDIEKTGKWQGELWNRKKDGTLYPTWQSVSTLYNDDGSVSHYISHSMDLTRDKESQRQINYLNNHDSLTKLPNRNLLIDRIEQQLENNQPNHSFLFLININRFKIFNESLGHTAGDDLLIQVAKRLKSLKLKDLYDKHVSRIGNDEFSFLCLTDIDDIESATLEAGHIATQIQTHLSEEFTIQTNQAVISTTLGVTLFTPNTIGTTHQTAETVIQEANTALHRAKQVHNNASIQFYESTMQQHAQQRLALEAQLRQALNNKEFILHYQPQKSLKTDEVIGMEALIRWQNSDGNLISPLDFIPILEETGLINRVGQWIIEEALSQAKILHKCHPTLTISINLSAVQFNDENLVSNIKHCLQKQDYPASRLEFEITESLLMNDIEQTLIKLNQLTALGVKIAIDDFGTGYSSLSYLKRFPINRLKIDKSFIDDITDTQDADEAIVRATIEMAHALHIDTIAEGVETGEQLQLLKTIDCDEIQGYYFSKPLNSTDLMQFINKHSTKC